MIKKILIVLACFWSSTSFAISTKKLSIEIIFDSIKAKSAYEESWDFKKTIKIKPILNKNNIIATRSVIKNNFPTTFAMLVKPTQIKEDEVTLQFNLLQYGFDLEPSIITQPRIVLKLGQNGEISSGPYRIKVSATFK